MPALSFAPEEGLHYMLSLGYVKPPDRWYENNLALRHSIFQQTYKRDYTLVWGKKNVRFLNTWLLGLNVYDMLGLDSPKISDCVHLINKLKQMRMSEALKLPRQSSASSLDHIKDSSQL